MRPRRPLAGRIYLERACPADRPCSGRHLYRPALRPGLCPWPARAGGRAARCRRRLGSRLNQVHQMTTAAIATAEAKLTASLSYRVAMRLQSSRRQKARSMTWFMACAITVAASSPRLTAIPASDTASTLPRPAAAAKPAMAELSGDGCRSNGVMVTASVPKHSREAPTLLRLRTGRNSRTRWPLARRARCEVHRIADIARNPDCCPRPRSARTPAGSRGDSTSPEMIDRAALRCQFGVRHRVMARPRRVGNVQGRAPAAARPETADPKLPTAMQIRTGRSRRPAGGAAPARKRAMRAAGNGADSPLQRAVSARGRRRPRGCRRSRRRRERRSGSGPCPAGREDAARDCSRAGPPRWRRWSTGIR